MRAHEKNVGLLMHYQYMTLYLYFNHVIKICHIQKKNIPYIEGEEGGH